MAEKEFGPGETPQSYGHGHPAGESNYPYQPSGQGYPGQPAPVSGQPYGQPGYAPQQGYAPQPGYAPAQMQIQAQPPDHFCLAVFVTLCCFWPTGIVAIMKASDARAATARGDIATANSQARSAKQMINISIGVGIASFVVIGIIIGVYYGLVISQVNAYSRFG